MRRQRRYAYQGVLLAAAALGVASVTTLALTTGGHTATAVTVEPNLVEAIDRSTDRGSDRYQACTGIDEAPGFGLYSLGNEFDGYPLTAILRQCERPGLDGDLGVGLRGNSVSYIYGSCLPPTDGEGGCAAPIEVQVWPACERAVTDYDFGLPPRLSSVRGVPALSVMGRVELYSADSTVVVFASSEALAQRAAESVQAHRAGASPRDVTDTQATKSPLPGPASGSLNGRLECS
jgi:hypothetical protein